MTTVTLADVLNESNPHSIDFLKIDVEGFEEEVLRGNDWAKHRPSVIVVEATIPESAERRPTEIKGYLADRDYSWEFFDGLNDFYFAREFVVPARGFDAPANIFDGFQLRRIVELEQQVAALSAEILATREQLAEIARHADAVKASTAADVRSAREQASRLEELKVSFAKLEIYAHSIEVGRDEAARYAHSLEQARVEAERYAKSLEGALAERNATLRGRRPVSPR